MVTVFNDNTDYIFGVYAKKTTSKLNEPETKEQPTGNLLVTSEQPSSG